MRRLIRMSIEYMFIIGGLIIILASFMIAYTTKGSQGYLTSSLLILGLFLAYMPYIILEYAAYLKIKKVEENFPKFLRDYSEAINSGMNFTQAFDFVLQNNYGPLNEYLKRGVNRLSIGVPFHRVLEMMREELKDSKMVSNSFGIIINAYYSGGDIGTTMSELAENVLSIKEVYAERSNLLHQQVTIMYAIFIVFLIMMFVLYRILAPLTASTDIWEMFGEGESKASNYCLLSAIRPLCTVGYVFGYTPEERLTYFRVLFFFMAIIEAISIGAVAGILSDGTLKAGLKHIGVLLTITLIAFVLVLSL